MSKVAVLGLGAMGRRMATNFQTAGHDVVGWNRSPVQDIPYDLARTPAAAAQGADFVVSMVRDDEASVRVWLDPEDGALLTLRHGIAIESSTVSYAQCERLHAAAREARVQFFDAPVAGSLPQVEQRQLVHLVGGDAVAAGVVSDLLLANGRASYVGVSGSGTLAKLAVNALLGVQVAAVTELAALLENTGFDAFAILEATLGTAVGSPVTKAALEMVREQRFTPLFPIELMEKDLRYGLALADRTRLPLTSAAQGVFKDAIRHGLGNLQIAATYKLFQSLYESGEGTS